MTETILHDPTPSGRGAESAPAPRDPNHLPAVSSLYVTQYLGVGFLSTGLIGIAREQGLSLTDLALITQLGMVWALKFLWAPMVDRYAPPGRGGHYRRWILWTQPLVVVSILALLPFGDLREGMAGVALVAGLYLLVSATQDVAVDALAARLFPSEGRGRVNGIVIGAQWLGTLVGGGLVVVVYDQFGWTPAVLLLAATAALPYLFVLRLDESTGHHGTPPLRMPLVSQALGVLRQPGATLWGLVVIPLLHIGIGGSYFLLEPALLDAGWSLSRAAVVLSVIIAVPAMLAGLVAGRLVDWFGRRAMFVVAGLGGALSLLPLLPLTGGRAPLVTTVLALSLFVVFNSVANALVYTVNMDLARPDTAGGDFTLLASLGMIVYFLGGGLLLGLAESLGYTTVLGIAGAFLVVATAAALLFFRARTDIASGHVRT
ncbi:MFS transporter [Kytococcus sp. Marseille-QA3725]